MKTKQYIILGFFVVTVVIIGWNLFSSQEKRIPKTFSQQEKTWETMDVSVSKDFSSLKIPAQVQSNRFAFLFPRRAGIIQDLLVDVGDEVSKGQIIGSMFPEGVEGQSSTIIQEASARLQKAKSELENLKGVSVNAVSVATQQLKESHLQSNTQNELDKEIQKQIFEKKSEAILVATQTWENIKILLFGTGTNNSSRSIQGSFSDSIQQNKVKNKADEIQRMEESDEWNNPDTILEHLSHLNEFLLQVEILYKNARETGGFMNSQIKTNLSIIQSQQIKVTQIKQSILALEEKQKLFSSVQAERIAGAEKSQEVLDLVQSQQNLTLTQAEKNVEVALANYNAALVKSGHQSVTSPFRGIITDRMVEVGQFVSMNMPLFALEGAQTIRSQQSLFEIHFNLPESWMNIVSVGDLVDVKTRDGISFKGRVFRLSHTINTTTKGVSGTIIEVPGDDIDSQKLTHGQNLFITFKEPESSIFTIPTRSLKKRSHSFFVWILKDNEPIQKEVEVLAEDGELSQIRSHEIQSGDTIITNPSVSLFKKSK